METTKRNNYIKARNKRNRNSGNKPATKKETYKKYGIDFVNGKIVSPVGNIPELLKEGNDKTGKLVYTFSVLPGTTVYIAEIAGIEIEIPGTCICDCIGCYAKTGRYRCDNVTQSMAVNTYLINYHLDFVRRCISAQLEYIQRGEIRIHAAGDFNTINADEYAGMWHDIAAKFTSFRMWTYTKIKKYETLFDDLKNANIVKSVIPGVGVNYGTCEYIINAYYTLKSIGKSVYICRCGIDKNQHCQNCGVCATYEYVLFIEHSTAYKAESDPLFEKLINIIDNQ